MKKSRSIAVRSYLFAVRRLALVQVAAVPAGLIFGAIGGGILLLIAPVAGGYWARTSSPLLASIGALFTVYAGICAIFFLLSLTDGGYTWSVLVDNFYGIGTFIIPSGLIGIALASSSRIRKLIPLDHPK